MSIEWAQNVYENHPLYWGNKARYKNFLIDLKELMQSRSSANYNVTEFVSYVIDKYELRKYEYFNKEAMELLFYCLYNNYKKFLKRYEEKSINEGNTASDMNLLRSVKGK